MRLDPTDSTDIEDWQDNYRAGANKKIAQRSPIQNAQLVQVSPLEGSSFINVTHDWCDKTTWYQKSTQVTGETLVLDAGTTYKAVNKYWIDLINGKVYDEDIANAGGTYNVKIYDNGVEQTSGITLDYSNGKVAFDSAPTGPVTADYYYAGSSEFCVAPAAGKVMIIEHAELQFTKDLSITSPIYFEVWVYNPVDLPNKMLYQRITYKNVKDLIASGNLGTGSIPACDNISQEILIFPWHYTTTKPFQSTLGAELRMSVADDSELTGEWGVATLYCLSKDE
jgi:hypothetical protein